MNIRIKIFILNIIALVLIISTPIVSAYVASSSSFTLEKDSINFSGTENSSSTLYRMSDTIGEVATGESTGTTFNLHAGYRAMEDRGTYITLSAPSDIALSSIGQAAGGSSEGSATWNVVTNNANGYRLSIEASTDPALQSSSSSFADYTPAGIVPDYTWAVDTTASEFGFTPEGDDVVARFLDDGSACNTGSGNTTSSCWDAFDTTDITIAEGAAANNPGGADTLVRVKAEIGSGVTQTDGSYSSTLTVTAITL